MNELKHLVLTLRNLVSTDLKKVVPRLCKELEKEAYDDDLRDGYLASVKRTAVHAFLDGSGLLRFLRLNHFTESTILKEVLPAWADLTGRVTEEGRSKIIPLAEGGARWFRWTAGREN